MTEFKSDQELWEYLMAGGKVVHKVGVTTIDDCVYLANGCKKYGNGKMAKNCLLTYDMWVSYD